MSEEEFVEQADGRMVSGPTIGATSAKTAPSWKRVTAAAGVALALASGLLIGRSTAPQVAEPPTLGQLLVGRTIEIGGGCREYEWAVMQVSKTPPAADITAIERTLREQGYVRADVVITHRGKGTYVVITAGQDCP